MEEHVRKTFSSAPTFLPANVQKIGPTEVVWFEPVEKVAVIVTEGGTVDDRRFAEELVALELGNFGYKKAQFTFDPDVTSELRKEASWTDIMAKAKRLIQSGNVQLLRNGTNVIVAHVIGDHGEYNCEISRDDPDSRAITQWTCECPWDQYAWGRTRQFKKFEGRPCAHVLAAFWKSQSTPLDEAQPPPGQNSPFTPQQPHLPVQQAPAPGMGQMPAEPQGGGPNPLQQVLEQGQPIAPPHIPMPTYGLPPQGQQPTPTPGPQLAPGQMPLFNPDTLGMPPSQQIPLMQPMDPSVIPPFPEEANGQFVLPVSVPGGRPGPYPGNPIQYPGGTFSHVAGANDDFSGNPSVRLEEATYGEAMGPKGNGGYREIPRNSIGESLGQDPTTGWVDCIFPLNDSGANEPYHVRAWIEPEKLTPMPQMRPFGPNRRSGGSIDWQAPMTCPSCNWTAEPLNRGGYAYCEHCDKPLMEGAPEQSPVAPKFIQHTIEGSRLNAGGPEDSGWAGRIPLVYDSGTHVVHIGQPDTTHYDTKMAATLAGHRMTGTPYHGWVGYNPEVFRMGDPDRDQNFGWYGDKPPGGVHEAVAQHFGIDPNEVPDEPRDMSGWNMEGVDALKADDWDF